MKIYNIVLCTLGTLGFCYVLNAPIKKIPFIIIGAFISASIFELLNSNGISIFLSTMAGSTAIGIYCEAIARIIKTPTTVILLPSTVPLLPGGSLYYTMRNLITGNMEGFKAFAVETILIGFGIAIGAIITSIIMQIILNRHKK